MLDKSRGNPAAENKRAARKRARSKAVTEAGGVNEPQSDWVHPWDAPFYCMSGNFIRSVEGWTSALEAEVKRIIEHEQAISSMGTPELMRKWSFGRATDIPRVWITAMGLQTVVQPAFLAVIPWAGDGPAELSNDLDRWVITAHGKDILAADAYNIRPNQILGLKWHKWLLRSLFRSWEDGFVQAVRRGAAHIMARKGSVLAPFERITWNQWQFFKMDKNSSKPPRGSRWGDPRGPEWHVGDLPWTATGPAGEKLYEIHIAPGPRSAQRGALTPEQEVIGWLAKLLSDHPEHPPKPLPDLAKQICSAFPELSERAFRQCLFQAQQQTGNRRWSEPGRWKSQH